MTELLHELSSRALFGSLAVELLQAHQQPLALFDSDLLVLNNGTLEKNEALVMGQVQMVGDGCVRLGKLALELELGQGSEKHSTCGGRREGPLQEVNLGTLTLLG